MKSKAHRFFFAVTLSGVVCTELAPSAQVMAPSAQAKHEPYTDPAAPRVFITDSQSWEMGGYSGGSGGMGGSMVKGGARPQTAEIIKTFRQRCPLVAVNNIPAKADYIVELDHEGGKGMLRHKNKVAVFARISGDSITSKSTLSLGASVQEACAAINEHWAVHSSDMGAAPSAAATEPVPAQRNSSSPDPPASKSTDGKVTVTSVPDGADVEIDGGFVGNTPSEIEVTPGEHTVSIKKTGFTSWERQLKVTNGNTVRLAATLERP